MKFLNQVLQSKKIKNILFVVYYFFRHPIYFIRFALTYITADRFTQIISPPNDKGKVSIIIVTHNALEYVKKCIYSLKKTQYSSYEIIVVDNSSESETITFLKTAKKEGLIDKLHLSSVNTYFSQGNNIGASLASTNSNYLLLLNSDVEIIDPKWLDLLLENAQAAGIISFGSASIPVLRPDGWCFLIQKALYGKCNGLNEHFQMSWSITELTAKILKLDFAVKTVINPGKYIIHYESKSWIKLKESKKKQDSNKKIKFNSLTFEEVKKLFINAQQVKLLRV